MLVLYNTFYVGLLNYGIKLTGDRDLAKDCITQILLRLWEKKDELPAVENVRGYLTICLRNEIFSEIKSSKLKKIRNRMMLSEHDTTEQPYEDLLIKTQQNLFVRQKLKKALEKLTQRQKELLELRYFEDLDYDEIAHRCNISKRTAYNLIQTGLINMRKHMFDDEPNVSVLSGIIKFFPVLFLFPW